MKIKLLLLTLLITLALTFTTYADIPHLINYQGKATDTLGALLNGTYTLTFRIYNHSTAGDLLWSEAHPNITITNGIFQLLLGSITPLGLAFDESYYLSVEVNSDGEMTPRTRFASVPYAYKAKEAYKAEEATLADSLKENPIPPGVMMIWSADISPEGWLLCDGSTVSREEYADLFNTIGTTYGAGDGMTTFNLPDLRGRFPLGKDSMGGVSADRVTVSEADNLGQGSGEENHTLTIAEIPSHSHAYTNYPPEMLEVLKARFLGGIQVEQLQVALEVGSRITTCLRIFHSTIS